MTIGESTRFAVEFELDTNHGGEWLFGRFCYWVSGVRVGNYDDGTSLRDVLFQLPTVLRDRGKRAHDVLYELSADGLYARLHGALFGPGVGEYEKVALEEQWARFNVKVPVDILDRCSVFVVERPPAARVLFSTDLDGPVREAMLRAGEVDDVLLRAYSELDRLHEREVKGTLG
jgi:hypothetical protein